MTKLFAQSPTRIVTKTTEVFDDRVPEKLASGADKELVANLTGLIGADHVLGRLSDLVRYASDASPYRLIPKVVVRPRNATQVAEVLRYCTRNNIHATFRAGGTSLSGQAQCDGVLIDVRHHWAGMAVEDEGRALRVRPGTVLSHAGKVLERLGRRLGPDPASAAAACLGGVLANNAAGMRCKLDRSAYESVLGLTFVLPSGTIINTADEDAETQFQRKEPDLAAGLMRIREQILSDPVIREKIRHKFQIRNTTGYAMRAFLDADTPLGIFRRLLVGSEGTLAFIAEAVLKTLPIPPVIGVGWIHARSMREAVAMVSIVRDLGAEAVEMLSAQSLILNAKRMEDAPADWRDLDPQGAALLVEFGVQTQEELEAVERQIQQKTSDFELTLPFSLETDPAFGAMSWKVRSQLNSDLALNRPAGAVNINEDVCFPPSRLAEAVEDLQELLRRYRYPDMVAGHAAYGNMHFTLTARLEDETERARYGQFMEEFADLVCDKYDGSLKAEHGTGINMAPFVPREWGPDITDLMWQIRRLADPAQILGKDVLITHDDHVHLRRFCSEPKVDHTIDRCIECGFCEPVCPSRFATNTPRQRIVLRREMARQPRGSAITKVLLQEYQYDSIEMCATDSSCSTACPYDINTGTLMKEFRQQQSTKPREVVAELVAKQWGVVERCARVIVGCADVISRVTSFKVLRAVTEALRTVISNDLMPTVPGRLPRPAKQKLPATSQYGADAVYFPACINRIFGRSPDEKSDISLPEALVDVSRRAGKKLWIPDDVHGHCCGTIWSSKGYQRGRDFMYEKIARSLIGWSDHGRLPVVVDASSCTHGLVADMKKHVPAYLARELSKVQIVDSVQWAGQLLNNLKVEKVGRVAVHPGCSVSRLGTTAEFMKVARSLADDVLLPYGAGCCGTAGDRGLLHPELVRAATRDERVDLEAIPADRYLASNRTCEMGLEQASGKPYESLIFLLDDTTRPISSPDFCRFCVV